MVRCELAEEVLSIPLPFFTFILLPLRFAFTPHCFSLDTPSWKLPRPTRSFVPCPMMSLIVKLPRPKISHVLRLLSRNWVVEELGRRGKFEKKWVAEMLLQLVEPNGQLTAVDVLKQILDSGETVQINASNAKMGEILK
ncbi:hypothetical protein K440DRAFT_299990 [Wilcoxina mikolae CBS 423.85]|nr:hypothetical protein K440DRAFT_299990 [Wilcoxina mikolae CBS 423.85]